MDRSHVNINAPSPSRCVASRATYILIYIHLEEDCTVLCIDMCTSFALALENEEDKRLNPSNMYGGSKFSILPCYLSCEGLYNDNNMFLQYFILK